MHLPLTPHPDFPPSAVTGVEVWAVRQGRRLGLHYRANGDPAALALPGDGSGERADELWRTTCFEAFVRRGDGGYYEFNLSPSTRWAAYGFSGYRDGVTKPDMPSPHIDGAVTDGAYDLRADLDLSTLVDLPQDSAWRLAVTAIIEEKSGAKSYWSLRHPAGKPDFHHTDNFVLDLDSTDLP
jgi:hypothetical protein